MTYQTDPPKFSEEKLWQVNKEKCIGCGTCAALCPKGAEMDKDGKAKVIDSGELKECDAENLCPYGAIEEVK
ncbi:MAG: ferredoxin [bacterium]